MSSLALAVWVIGSGINIALLIHGVHKSVRIHQMPRLIAIAVCIFGSIGVIGFWRLIVSIIRL